MKKIKERHGEFIKVWYSLCNKELLGFSEMRSLFNKFNVSEDVLDLMLIKFVEKEIGHQKFFQKIDSFIEMNAFLENPEIIKGENASQLGDILFSQN